jgi:hypothetical protein
LVIVGGGEETGGEEVAVVVLFFPKIAHAVVLRIKDGVGEGVDEKDKRKDCDECNGAECAQDAMEEGFHGDYSPSVVLAGVSLGSLGSMVQ